MSKHTIVNKYLVMQGNISQTDEWRMACDVLTTGGESVSGKEGCASAPDETGASKPSLRSH